MAGISPKDAQKYFKGIDYPATKAELLDTAQDNGADDMMIDSLRDELPDGVFDSVQDVNRSLGDSM